MTSWPAGVGREILAELDSTNAEALRRAAGRRGGAGLDLRAAADRGARAAGAGLGDGGGELRGEPPDAAAGDERRGAGAAVVRGGARASRRDGGGDRAAGALRAQVAERRAARRAARSRGSCSRPAGRRGGRRRSSSGSGSTSPRRRRPGELEPGAVAPASLRGRHRDRHRRRRISSTCWRRRWTPGRSGSRTRASRRCARPGWRGRAGIGEEITARLPDRALTGRFETIDATGALVLATDGGPGGAAGGGDPFRGRRAHAARH